MKRAAISGRGEMEDRVVQRSLLPFPLDSGLGAVVAAVTNMMTLLNSSSNVAPLSLTWTNFAGAPPSRTRFSAETRFNFQIVTVNNTQIVQAVFDGAASWVNPQFGAPANRATNGCQTNVGNCQQFFTRNPSGGTWSLSTGASRACPASATHNPATANNFGECSTVVGTECDNTAQRESQRLLRHEQYHFKLASEIAKKGIAAILSGEQPAPVLAKVRRAANRQTALYDRQTNHGCRAAQQASWETQIDGGLPNVRI